MATIQTTLKELEEELNTALSAYETTLARRQQASKAHTDSINRLNKVQQAIDRHFALLRKNAPYESDWTRPEHRGCV